ncbi:MAG: hypothetical protein HN348_24505 [Proteobacteria bacterium]|nr:hypothetical protein [Pseudomonadota bacterium]
MHVPVLNLRGSDPTMLEVQLQDLLRRPLGQIAMVNMLDVMSLSDLGDGVPATLRPGVKGFVKQMTQEISDLPNGQSWTEFVDELAEVDATLVPHQFRAIFKEELGQTERDQHGANLVDHWQPIVPAPFELTQTTTRVVHAEVANEPESISSRKGIAAAKTKPPAKRRKAAPPSKDIEREEWITECILERIRGCRDQGLSETVLVAGVRHRAKTQYPDLMPFEIQAVLRKLKENGRARYRAGRWKSGDTW